MLAIINGSRLFDWSTNPVLLGSVWQFEIDKGNMRAHSITAARTNWEKEVEGCHERTNEDKSNRNTGTLRVDDEQYQRLPESLEWRKRIRYLGFEGTRKSIKKRTFSADLTEI